MTRRKLIGILITLACYTDTCSAEQPKVEDVCAIEVALTSPHAKKKCFHSSLVPGLAFGPLVMLYEGPTTRYLRATYFHKKLIGYVPARSGTRSTPGVLLAHMSEFIRDGQPRLLFERYTFSDNGDLKSFGWNSLNPESGEVLVERLPEFTSSQAYVVIVSGRYAVFPTITRSQSRDSSSENMFLGYTVTDLDTKRIVRRFVSPLGPLATDAGQPVTIDVQRFTNTGRPVHQVFISFNVDCPKTMDEPRCALANNQTFQLPER